MNAFSSRYPKSINWSAIVMFTLGFWLSASLVFDLLIVPGLLSSGMMNESGFASAGYLIFGTFNHVELLCAALVLAGCLVFRYGKNATTIVTNELVWMAGVLLAITLVYTYILTPQMSGMGLAINEFSSTKNLADSMTIMHLSYWWLEVVKLAIGTVVLRACYRNSCSLM
jgi:hypothetical protein